MYHLYHDLYESGYISLQVFADSSCGSDIFVIDNTNSMKLILNKAIFIFLFLGLTWNSLFGQQSVYLDSTSWEAYLQKSHAKGPAFDFVQGDPTLPDILIIGNSISIGYTPTVRTLLQGKANVYRIPENGGDTRKFLERNQTWLEGMDWDLIHFNVGLHDLKRVDEEGKLNQDYPRRISPENYSENLDEIFTILEQRTDAVIVWAATTFVPEGSEGRISGDEILYNKASMEVLKDFPDIMVNDLHAYSLGIKAFQREANVHYYPAGSAMLGSEVARVLGGILFSAGD